MIDQKAVAKRKKRTSIANLQIGQKEPKSAILTTEDVKNLDRGQGG